MSSEKQITLDESPIKYSEVLIAVVAALAVEQSAQSLFLFIASGNQDFFSIVRTAVLSLLIIITTIRFYHGNSVYLTKTYSKTHYQEFLPNKIVIASYAQYIDIIFHLIQYLCLVGCGYFIEYKFSNYFRLFLIMLFLIDIIWTTAVSSKYKADRSFETVNSWLKANSITFVALIIIHLLVQFNFIVNKSTLYVALILLLNTIYDYHHNYEHYFSNTATNDCRQLNLHAKAAIEYITAVEQISSQHYNTGSPENNFKKYIEFLFLPYMGNIDMRSKLFITNKAKLHVGIYFEKNGILYPALRYFDNGITITNRKFKRGESYVGYAFNYLEDKKNDEALCFNSRQNNIPYSTNQVDADRVHYNSSILANIFLDSNPKREAIGVLNITSNQNNTFVEEIHNPTFINIARKISQVLSSPEFKSNLDSFRTNAANGNVMIINSEETNE